MKYTIHNVADRQSDDNRPPMLYVGIIKTLVHELIILFDHQVMG